MDDERRPLDKLVDLYNTLSTTPSCTVIGSYKLPTGETCELLAFCQPGELVDDSTMIACGEANQASMGESDFQKFWKYHDIIPFEFWNYYFVFPKAFGADGGVRFVRRYYDNWHQLRGIRGHGWGGEGGVLVRFRPAL